jgi:hypothetical protein
MIEVNRGFAEHGLGIGYPQCLAKPFAYEQATLILMLKGIQ